MSRAVGLFLSSVLAVFLAGGVAQAIDKRCGDVDRCVGTPGNDALLGAGRDDWMVGRGGNDTLDGRAGADYLYGSEGNDLLLGGDGSGIDAISGGPGKDRLKGGPGPDNHYFHSAAWGRDTISGDRYEGYATDESAAFQRTSARLVIDLNSRGVNPEARTASGKSTVDWGGSRVGALFSGQGDNIITGRSNATSEIYARGGDDFVYVDDGADDDRVDCGGGFDTVFSDPGDTVAPDCDVLNPPTG